VEDFDGSTRWVSHAQVEKLLAAAFELAGDEETFCTALAYRFEEGYGAFRYKSGRSPSSVWRSSRSRCRTRCSPT
jgi:hypothetical protein